MPKTDDVAEAKLLGRALASLRKARGLNQHEAGAAFGGLEGADEEGMTGQGWGLYETGKRIAIFRPEVQRKLASALGASIEDLIAERDRLAGIAGPSEPRGVVVPLRTPDSAMLPIRDRVQAGAWLMASDLDQDQPATYPALRDPRFQHADQWLSSVVGDSVNRLNIFDGDLVHCVDVIGAGYYPKTGDIVEVERIRFNGQERELTLKQVEVGADGTILLWPRSTNPRWQEPLELRQGAGDNEDIEVRIRGLVLSAIHRFQV